MGGLEGKSGSQYYVNQLFGDDDDFLDRTRRWTDRAMEHRYSYHFEWLGRPIIQFPQDIVAMQEIVWAVQPDLIIETGIAHGALPTAALPTAPLPIIKSCLGSSAGVI